MENSLATNPEDKINCIICKAPLDAENKNTVRVTRGIETIKKCSNKRNDGIAEILKNVRSITVHIDCRRTYTDPRKVHHTLLEPPKTLRSSVPAKTAVGTVCVLCMEKLPTPEVMKKHPTRYSVSSISDLETLKSLLKISGARQDELGATVSDRLRVLLQDPKTAISARYHKACYTKFLRDSESLRSPQPQPLGNKQPTSGRRSEATKEEGLLKLCKYISECDECQFLMADLRRKMEQLTEGNESYADRYLLSKLQEYFGDLMTVSTKPGAQTVVCFGGSTRHKIFLDRWHQEKKADDKEERKRVVQAASAIIRQDVRKQVFDLDSYPETVDVAAAEDIVPETLQIFLDSLPVPGKGKHSKLTASRKCLFMAHSLMSLCRPRSFLSSLHIALAVFIHRRFASKELICMLHSLGICASYSEVVAYENSVTILERPELDLVHFVQYVFDNADHNIQTVDGHGTFHSMGGIRVVTPAVKSSFGFLPRKMQAINTDDIAKRAYIPLVTYNSQQGRGLLKLKVSKLEKVDAVNSLLLARSLDAVWTAGPWLREKTRLDWGGFMTVVTRNVREFQASSIQILPFVNLTPTNPSTIYSCLSYASNECQKRGQSHCIVTFDLPLYMKAMEIILTLLGLELQNIVLRLGGFHMAMSFMGSIGNIMAGSGIEELWAVVYAKNSIPQMLAGHAFSRALKAHSLTQVALFTHLIEINEEIALQVQLGVARTYRSLLNGNLEHANVPDISEVRSFALFVDSIVEDAAKKSRTGRLWTLYIKLVSILRNFIRAERSGDWQLHLHSVRAMIPIFHATAHHNYAKAAHMYLQDMMTLEQRMDVQEFQRLTLSGFFTVRRSEDKYWSGIWSDMTIEQTLMKEMKLKGGLTHGRGFSDSTVAKWIMTLPATVCLIDSLRQFCGVSSGSSEQHVEMRDSRQNRFVADVQKFHTWILQHSPFNKSPHQLVSLSSGIVGDPSVNCDEADIRGEEELETITGKSFGDLHLSRKSRVITLARMTKTIKVQGENVTINSSQLFHRIVCVAKDEKYLSECLQYELAPWPPALFDDFCLMRKGTKSSLIPIVAESSSTVSLPENPTFTLDGGFLLHKVVWAIPCSFRDIVKSYTTFVGKNYGRTSPPRVVFDGYSKSTKDEERMRRTAMSYCPDYEVDLSTVLAVPKTKFLSNIENKKKFIALLKEQFLISGINAIQAEGDADRLIVSTAMKQARRGYNEIIVGEDTDLLVLLVALPDKATNVHLLIPGRGQKEDKIFSSADVQRNLDPFVSEHILFLHAISGCDTTSTPYRKGKKLALSKLTCPALSETLRNFKSPTAKADDIADAGEAFMRLLYSGEPTGPSLDQLRSLHYHRTIARQPLQSRFDLAVLPPTSDAAKQHSFRAYFQVQQWLGNPLDPTEWGWKEVQEKLCPVPTTKPAAPENLLRLITCRCKKECGARCECRRAGLQCSSMCGYCDSCSNSIQVDVADNDLSDPDDPENFPESALGFM